MIQFIDGLPEIRISVSQIRISRKPCFIVSIAGKTFFLPLRTLLVISYNMMDALYNLRSRPNSPNFKFPNVMPMSIVYKIYTKII